MSAAPQQGPLKDHEIREVVNAVRGIAQKFHDHDSLRERLARVIVPALQRGGSQELAETQQLLALSIENSNMVVGLVNDLLEERAAMPAWKQYVAEQVDKDMAPMYAAFEAPPPAGPAGEDIGHVTATDAREALDSMDDYARMQTGVDAIGPRRTLEAFISQAEAEPPPAEYGSTDLGYDIVGVPVTAGDKRLMKMVTDALGNDHPAFNDLMALVMTARSRSAPPASHSLAEALTAERERLCAAIKAADDKASEGDYMLDSDDCISVIRGTWNPQGD